MSIQQATKLVRCVTINLAGVGSDWFGARGGATARGLQLLAPDVVCFQETTITSGPEPYNQAVAIGETLGLPFAAFAPYGNPVETTSLEVGGVAVAARWPMVYVENRRLPAGGGSDGPDNRVALLVKLLAPWGELFVTTTHLSWRPEQEAVRLQQLGVILDYLAALGLCRENAPLVLTGDLNALEGHPVIQRVSRQLRDAFRSRHPDLPGFTWSRANPLTSGSADPDRRLDYLFCPSGTHILEAAVVLDRSDPVYPSDHFGLYVVLELP